MRRGGFFLFLFLLLLVGSGAFFFFGTKSLGPLPSTQRDSTTAIQSDTLSLEGLTNAVVPDTAVDLTFSIVKPSGERRSDFSVDSDQLMHVSIFRKDFAEFQHFDPAFSREKATFTLPQVIFPAPGPYTILAEYDSKQARTEITVGDLSLYIAEPLSETTAADQVLGDLRYRIKSSVPALLRGRDTPLEVHLFLAGSSVERSDLESYEGGDGACLLISESGASFQRSILSAPVEPGSTGYRCAVRPAVGGKAALFVLIKRDGRNFILPSTLVIEEL